MGKLRLTLTFDFPEGTTRGLADFFAKSASYAVERKWASDCEDPFTPPRATVTEVQEAPEKIVAGVDWGFDDKTVLSFAKVGEDGKVKALLPSPAPGTQYPCPICGTKGTWTIKGGEFTHTHMSGAPGPFPFFVDGELRTHDHERISGKVVKGLYNIDKTYQLFVEKPGDEPDRSMSDDDMLLLWDSPRIYSVPPAAFGGKRWQFFIDSTLFDHDKPTIEGVVLLRLLTSLHGSSRRLYAPLPQGQAIEVSHSTAFRLDMTSATEFFTLMNEINGG